MDTTPNETKPPSFKDSTGREWSLSLNIGLARQLKETTGLDFCNLTDGQPFIALTNDGEKLAQTLWIFCEKQATQPIGGVTPEEFAERLDADAIDAAANAVLEAVVRFTRAPLRGAMRKAMDATVKAQATSAAAVETWVETNSEKIAAKSMSEAQKVLATHGDALLR